MVICDLSLFSRNLNLRFTSHSAVVSNELMSAVNGHRKMLVEVLNRRRIISISTSRYENPN